jgi:hypothetical protein
MELGSPIKKQIMENNLSNMNQISHSNRVAMLVKRQQINIAKNPFRHPFHIANSLCDSQIMSCDTRYMPKMAFYLPFLALKMSLSANKVPVVALFFGCRQYNQEEKVMLANTGPYFKDNFTIIKNYN